MNFDVTSIDCRGFNTFFLIDFSINFAARVFEMRTSDLGLDFFSYFDFSSYYFN